MPETFQRLKSFFKHPRRKRSNTDEVIGFLMEEVSRLDEEIQRQNEENHQLKEENLKLKEENKNLQEKLQALLRKRFKRSSEGLGKGDPEKLVTVKGHQRRAKKEVTPQDQIIKEEEIIDLPEEEKTCPHHHCPLVCIGEDSNEKLHYIPATIKLVIKIFKKYACPHCKDQAPKRVPPPPSILPKTKASGSLLAEVVLKKFADSLPLYRQVEIFKRIGLELSRSTLAAWVIESARSMITIYNLLQDLVLDRDYCQMDETTFQVLNEEGKKPTSLSYLWARFCPGEDPIILFDYAPTRAGKVAVELLEGFFGYLQVDGYSGYSKIASREGIVRLGCMDHCRRYFWEAYNSSSGKGVGKKGLLILRDLYEVERDIKDLSPNQRHDIRQKKCAPLLKKFKDFIESNITVTSEKSLAGRALHYAQKEWDALNVFLEDGRLEMSNIFIENKIRPFAVGRKNWLFSSSVEGAEASAFYYGLIGTAKANGLQLSPYLNFLFEEFPKAKSLEDFEALLPLRSIQEKRNPSLLLAKKT